MDPHNLPTTADELKTARLTELQEQIEKLKTKVTRDEAQAADTRKHLSAKLAEFEECAAAEHEFVAPGELVEARAL